MKVQRAPDVSVCIPSHRWDGYATHAAQSVREQTHTNVQICVNHCMNWWDAKFNDTVAMARGEYYVLLCDDDHLRPTFVHDTLAIAREGGYDIVYPDARCYGATFAYKRMGPWTREAFIEGNPLWLTALVRKQLWLDLGGFDMTQPWYDYDFWWRAFKAGAKAAHLAGEQWDYRVHPGQGSNSTDEAEARRLLWAKHPELARAA